MKKIIIYTILLLCTVKTYSQISLDTIINPWNAIGYDMYPIKISVNETKYYVQDTLTNTFNLYNLDFSPFLLNVAVPESYSPFTKNMEVIYISRTLFDCDSTNIEYAYTAIGSGFNPFYIMRTDGTMLFKLDSALAPYVIGALNGSQDIRPIMNTESGAKLFLYYPKNTNNLYIYSLCGTLNNNLFSMTNTIFNESFVNVSPNPSTGVVSFQMILPDNLNTYSIRILDSKGRTLTSKLLDNNNFNNTFNFESFSNGQYYYNVYQNNLVYYSGKFLIAK